VALWMLLDRTRLGAMIRAGVGRSRHGAGGRIRVSQLFTIVFRARRRACGLAGHHRRPILSVYPGSIRICCRSRWFVVILGGTGSLLGSVRRQHHRRLHL